MSQPLPKVTLRAVEPEDLDLLYKIENDQRLWNVGVTNVPYSRYTLHDYVANCSDDIYADHQVRLIIEDSGGNAVGLADISNFSPRHMRAEVGIVILDDCRRKGYATAALQHLCQYSRNIIHLHQLYAIIEQTNQKALSLFAKDGFSEQAVLKDWLFDGASYSNALLMQKIL